jgi:hypothetical protein
MTQQPEQSISAPVGGDLNQELAQAGRGPGKITIGLGIAVLVVVAFFGGVWAHSATAGSTAAPATPQAGQRAQGQGNRGVPPSGTNPAAGRAGTIGTVDRIDGTTVYLKAQDGTEIKVSTSDATRVEISQPGQLSDLKPGASVVVQGQRTEDGVTAQTITKRPQ